MSIMQRLEKKFFPFEFSPILKHPKYTILSPTLVRSDDISNDLCLLTPALDQRGGMQKFGFKWVKGG